MIRRVMNEDSFFRSEFKKRIDFFCVVFCAKKKISFFWKGKILPCFESKENVVTKIDSSSKKKSKRHSKILSLSEINEFVFDFINLFLLRFWYWSLERRIILIFYLKY